MAIHFLKRLEDKGRDYCMWLDYSIYALFNPLKYVSFPKKIRRILVVELLRIGDVLVATPTLRALKEKWDSAEIDVLVAPEGKEALRYNPHIHELVSFTTFDEVKKKIKDKNYDLGIILHPGSFQISWLLFSAGVKYRVGCTKSGIRYGKGLFLNKKIRPNNRWRHKIEDNLDVVRSIGVDAKNKKIELPVDKNAAKKIEQKLKKYGKRIIAIHAPSQHRSQQWIPERFAAVADALAQKYNCVILFTGTAQEKKYIEMILQQTRLRSQMVNFAGETTVQEFIAVIDRMGLLISVDTGAIHIAAARNVPTIALFGPTIPTFWRPSHERSAVLWKEKTACVGCRKYYCVFKKNYECMRSITVEEVVREADLLLKKHM